MRKIPKPHEAEQQRDSCRLEVLRPDAWSVGRPVGRSTDWLFGGPLASTGWVARPVGVSVGRLMDWLAGFMVCGWVAVTVTVTVTAIVTVSALEDVADDGAFFFLCLHAKPVPRI